jgi:hypothetical protein
MYVTHPIANMKGFENPLFTHLVHPALYLLHHKPFHPPIYPVQTAGPGGTYPSSPLLNSTPGVVIPIPSSNEL